MKIKRILQTDDEPITWGDPPYVLSAFQGQAIMPNQIVPRPTVDGTPLKPGLPEWLALLRSMGEGNEPVSLSDEDLRRENLYGDDLR